MRVTHFPCGPAANESEMKAFEYLKGRLQSEPGDEEWVLLTNLAFSVNHQFQSDEIDVVVIGPTGARVIEVKHWTIQWFDAHRSGVEDEADRVTNKARKIGTTLRRVCLELPRVDGTILLTQEPSKVKRVAGQDIHGVRFHTLNDWKAAIGFEAQRMLSSQEVMRLARVLEPKSAVAIDGSLRRLAGYVNLELQTLKMSAFTASTRAVTLHGGIAWSCISTICPPAMTRTPRPEPGGSLRHYTDCNSIPGHHGFWIPIKTPLDTQARCFSSRLLIRQHPVSKSAPQTRVGRRAVGSHLHAMLFEP
jgi:nuclease-like protein